MEERKKELLQKIGDLKKKQNAVILAHNYQKEEIQEAADFVGDSFELSLAASRSSAGVIVFCGVYFMAEVAAILAPDKTVLIPDPLAGCPLADSITAEALQQKKKEYPDAAVVAYVNSSAEVKAESDICVTSSNAVAVVNSLEADEIIFIPDKNLGYFIERQTGKKVILWDNYCPSHHCATTQDVLNAREQYSESLVLVHPECRPEVVNAADYTFSTGKILKYAKETSCKSIVVGTEIGIIPRLQKENPEKRFYPLSEKMYCPDMKLITLDKLLHCLNSLTHQVTVPRAISERARQALDLMLAIV